MANSKLHAGTRCQIINLADMKFEFWPWRFKAIFPDGNVLESNFCEHWQKFQNKTWFRFFLIDNKDRSNMEKVWSECKTQTEKELRTEDYLGSLTKFSKHFSKRIYVRLIPPLTVGSEEGPRVFAGEVMEIIPVVMKQQGVSIREDDYRLVNHRVKCANLPLSGGYSTYTVKELESILDEFDIDKSLITLVPDPSHEMMRRQLLLVGGHIRFFSPDNKVVSDVYQAVNHIFQAAVMGVNWKKEECKLHEECNKKVKTVIMRFFKRLAKFPTIWLDCNKQFHIIQQIRGHCESPHRSHGTMPSYFFPELPAHASIHFNTYEMTVNSFGLPKYPVFPPASEGEHLPIWMLRVLCKFGWIQQFFDEEDSKELKKIMIECLYFMVPEEHIAATKEFVRKVINGSLLTLSLNSVTAEEFAEHQTRMSTFAELKKKDEEKYGKLPDPGFY